MAQILVPAPLRAYTRGHKIVNVSGSTVDEALATLTENYPDIKRHLYSDEGKLRNFVNVYLGQEDVRYLEQGATPVRENDTLTIVPSVAGGNLADPEVKTNGK